MRVLVGIGLVLIAAGALVAAPRSQVTGQRTIDIVVQQPDRSFVPTVSSSDLRVTIAGSAAAVDRVARLDDAVSVVLLVDLSRSVGVSGPAVALDPSSARGVLAAIDHEFVRRLPATDRARVAWFAGSAIRATDAFTSDRVALATAVHELLMRHLPSATEAGGSSPMVDAVAAVADLMAREPGRRAILLISDGESSANRLSLEEGARRAAANSVAVHAMLDAPTSQEVDYNFAASRYPRGFDRGRLLSKLAGLTGGAFRRDDRFSDFSWGFTMPMPPFEYFFTAMHSGFRVTLSGANLMAGAPVEVTAKDPKWLVSAPRWLPTAP